MLEHQRNFTSLLNKETKKQINTGSDDKTNSTCQICDLKLAIGFLFDGEKTKNILGHVCCVATKSSLFFLYIKFYNKNIYDHIQCSTALL